VPPLSSLFRLIRNAADQNGARQAADEYDVASEYNQTYI
jgi:hypothetical protein